VCVPYRLSSKRVVCFLLANQNESHFVLFPQLTRCTTTILAKVRSRFLPITNNIPYHKYIFEAVKGNDAQREGRRTLRLRVSVQLTDATSRIPQVDTFFLHMLNPLYTTPPPPSHVLCCHLIYSTPCSLLLSLKLLKMSSAPLGRLRLCIPHSMEPSPLSVS
jgi:hypothetical protein